MSTTTPSGAPAPTPPRTTTAAGTATAVAMLVLAVAVVVAHLVTGGAPNPGMAAVAVLPLLAAWAAGTGRRWGAHVAVLSVALVLGLRTVDLSFDLVRPAAVAPFAVAATTVLSAGIGLVAATLTLVARRRAAAPAWADARVATGAGLVVGALLGALLLLAFPQTDDTGDLSDAQVAALPTIEMVNFKFEPGMLRVAEGQPVAFRFDNDTDDAHSFTVDAFDVDVTVPSGRSRVVVVEAPAGSYPFHCAVGSHREDGMHGRLVVLGEHDHAGHDHAGHDHAGHDHAGHDHGSPEQRGHGADHAGQHAGEAAHEHDH